MKKVPVTLWYAGVPFECAPMPFKRAVGIAKTILRNSPALDYAIIPGDGDALAADDALVVWQDGRTTRQSDDLPVTTY